MRNCLRRFAQYGLGSVSEAWGGVEGTGTHACEQVRWEGEGGKRPAGGSEKITAVHFGPLRPGESPVWAKNGE